MTLALSVDVYFVGFLVILGTAYFYIIWDCARKNFKDILDITEKNDTLILRVLQIVQQWAHLHGFDTQELQKIIQEYEENSKQIKEHKL